MTGFAKQLRAWVILSEHARIKPEALAHSDVDNLIWALSTISGRVEAEIWEMSEVEWLSLLADIQSRAEFGSIVRTGEILVNDLIGKGASDAEPIRPGSRA